jgi:hypothetical protein
MTIESKAFRVWYWDPCNGMNSRSQDKGLFKSREAAQKFINDRVGEPGSVKRLSPDNWERDSYSIQEVEFSG